MAYMARLDMAINMVFMGVFSKIKQKWRSTLKTVPKNMQMVQSCGQNKFVTKILALSLVFWPRFDLILRSLGGPLNLFGFE